MSQARLTPIRWRGGLADLVQQITVADLLDSAVAVLDAGGHVVYRNDAFARFDRAVRDAPENLVSVTSLLECPGPRAAIAACLQRAAPQTLAPTFYYGRHIPADLTLVLRPILDADDRLEGVLVHIAEESVEYGGRSLVRLQHDVQELTKWVRRLSADKLASDRLIRALLAHSPFPMILFNRKRQVIQVNRAWEELTGNRMRDVVGESCELFYDCFSSHGGCPLLEGRAGIELEERTLACGGGRAVPVLRSAAVFTDASEPVIVEALIDLSERKRADAERDKLSRAVEQTADSVIITDPDGVIEYVNPAFERTTGYLRTEAIGRRPSLVKSGRHDQAFYERMWRTIHGGEVFRDVLVNRRQNGEIYYEEKTITPLKDASGRITHFISTGKDITERMQTQERLQYLAHHDSLTDLPNRFLFVEHLKHAIAHHPRTGRHMAVLFLDLDRFKIINDTLGHAAGDEAMRLAGERIQGALRAGDTIARLGGDEFAVLLEDLAAPDDVPRVIDKIQRALARPFVLQEREFFLSASIGVSQCPADGTDPLTLLRNADSAMYRAKEQGRDGYCFYSSEMSAKAFERQALEASLRRALEREEFVLHYQPQVSLAGGAPVGFEALLRWQHAELGVVSPAQFIPLAEESGLIVAIDEWVLGAAIAQLAAWRAAELPAVWVAVNLSGRSFALPDLPQRITRLLARHGVDAAHLELEITEGVVMQSGEATVSALEALKRQGLRLAIDDFGTGYSSLSYLKRFSIDTLKIDQAFVRDLATDADDRAIAAAVIALANSLKLRVIAEGVETDEQLAILRDHGCHLAQGYRFARPMPAAAAEAWLRAAVSRGAARD